ncbi:hypothetical protein AAMO2058_000388100 [Amorphochlora amoebiformis]
MGRGRKMKHYRHRIEPVKADIENHETRFQLTLTEADEMAVLKVDEWVEIKDKKEGEEKSPKVDRIPGEDELVKKLLSKAAPIEAKDDDVKEFFKREKSIKPPIPGKIVNVAFPGKPEERKEVEFDPKDLNLDEVADAVEVTRVAPEGNVHYPISRIKIGFNQAMVSVGTVDDVASEFKDMGIKISPTVEGAWRWSGTKLCQFMCKTRCRYSTTYKVSVPTGLKSAIGGSLEKDKSFQFTTPTVKIGHLSDFPSQDIKPVITVTFNQDIKKEVLYKSMKVTGNKAPKIVVLESPSDENSLEAAGLTPLQVKHILRWWEALGEVQQGRAIAFCFQGELQKDSSYTYSVDSKSVCGEGPLPCGGGVSSSFRTYPKFMIRYYTPDPSKPYSKCYPHTPYSFVFNNSINRKTVRKEHITIEPKLPNLKIRPQSTYLRIDHDPSKIGTQHVVTISKNIKDKWGQSLTGTNTFKITRVSKPPPPSKWGALSGPSSGEIINLDPFSLDAEVLVSVTNYESVKVIAYHMTEKDMMFSNFYDSKYKQKGFPFKKIGEKKVEVPANKKLENRDKPQPLVINLNSFYETLAKGDKKKSDFIAGRIFVTVEPTKKAFEANTSRGGFSQVMKYMGNDKEWMRRPFCTITLQRTRMAVDIIGHSNKGFVWVTDLRTGAPIENASVEMASWGRNAIKQNVKLGKTDSDGILKIGKNFDSIDAPGGSGFTLAKLGYDSVLQKQHISPHGASQNLFHVFNDRGLYKPNETVSIKGFCRKLVTKGEAYIPTYLHGPLQYIVYDPRGEKIKDGEVKLSEYGSFDLKITLPDNVNLGTCRVNFRQTKPGTFGFSHSFSIQEFRRPEFTVSASHRPTNHQFMNPLEADWLAIAQDEKKKSAERIVQVLTSIDTVIEKRRQMEEEKRERAGDKKLGEAEEEKKKKEQEEKEAKEKEEAKAEEKRVREQLKPVEHKFANSAEPTVIASVDAIYFSGGGLSDAKVRWEVSATESNYKPPKHSDFTFGKAIGWWWEYRTIISNSNKTFARQSFETKTDSKGHAEVAMSWSGLIDRQCKSLTLEANAQVIDLNNQARAASTTFIVHPCRYYVGFRMATAAAEAGKPLKVDVVVVTPTGETVPGRKVEIMLSGNRTIRMLDDQGLDINKVIYSYASSSVESKAEPATCKLIPVMGGTYNVHVKVYDDYGGWHESSSSTIYVSDPKGEPEKGVVSYNQLKMWKVPSDSVVVMPDKKSYEPGDTAVFTIRSPISPASGVGYVGCHGVKGDPIPFVILEGKDTVEVKVPVKKDWIPGFYFRAVLCGQSKREAPAKKLDGKAPLNAPLRPSYAVGQVRVEVTRECYKLDVKVAPCMETDDVGPGKTINSSVVVTDYAGNPVSGVEVCLVMVDEAILSLCGHQLTNPLSIFYPERSQGLSESRNRNHIFLLPLPDQKDMEIPEEEDMLEDEEECEDFCAMDIASAMPMASNSAPRMASNSAHRRGLFMKKKCKSARRSRASLETEEKKSEASPEDMGLDDDGPIAVRKNFNPLACFAPMVLTDAKGEAKFEIALPDNLTSYRVWATAATEQMFGFGEESIKVSLPLMLRPSPPRFLNFGDKCMVSAVLQNQTNKSLVAMVAARATNAKVDNETAAAKVTLQPLQRGLVLFGMSAEECGIARMQFVTSTRGASDAAEVSLPVYTPATSEGFATYGSVDIDGHDTDLPPKEEEEPDLTAEEKEVELKRQLVVQPIKAPKDVWPQFGGLEISTSTTQLQHLTDAVIALHDYTFECSEQLASRVIGLLSVRDVLKAFKSPKLPNAADLKSSMSKWLEKLYKRQHRNGGFWTWGPPMFYGRIYYPSPYTTIHACLCLSMCEEMKFPVKSNVKRAALTYLRNIEARVREVYWYCSQKTMNGLVSYALYVRARWGDPVGAEAAKYFKKSGGLKEFSTDAKCRLLVALSLEKKEQKATIAKIKKSLEKHVTEEADTAYFTEAYTEEGRHIMLQSNRKSDAILLEALVAVDRTKNVLSPKLCKGLLKHKLRSGGWGSTQENCFVLLGLLRYFREYEKHVPDFKVSLWYGNLFGGVQEWKGRTTETKQALIPMRGVMALGDNNFMLHKEGKGRLYYRIGMNYAPKSLFVKASNYGFLVSRKYAPAARDPKDNVQFDAEAKVWRAKLGEKVKVTITMTTTAKRFHVALVDFLPAGLEPLNPALKGTPKTEDDATGNQARSRGGWNPYRYRFYSRKYWPEHINLRDERAEAFRSLLWPGVYEFTYTARATTAGEFVVPPAKAEEMYSPENFGRSSSERMIIA